MPEATQPPSDQESAYLPPGPPPIVFDNFIGIDTSAPRAGIPDEAMAWCDGFMPVEKGNLRVLPDIGQLLYSAPAHLSVVFYDFANLGSLPLCIIFLSDGSIVAVNIFSHTNFTVAPAGTIVTPALGTMGISQWGSQFILIVADQPNGYFIWDGALLYDSGTIGPLVTVTNSGLNYTSSPTVTASGGSGSGATFQAIVATGSVENINVLSPGSGYKNGDQVILTISGGGSDSSASATANITSSGGIESIAVTNGGGGYSSLSFMVLSPVNGANVTPQAQAGTITGVTIFNPGTGFVSPPTVTISDPNSPPGSGATFTAYLGNGQITSVTITSGGSGYTTPPTVTVTGDGEGAELQATISAGAVTGIDIINAGLGYTKASIVFTGGNNGATATVDIMPFGIRGTAIETFQSRPWIVNGALLQFAAPESLMDFATSDGGGAAMSTDSFLRVAYTKPIQTNGFLYLVADSSLNYISGVQTSGTPPTTTYTNQNADPEIGTPWSTAINVFSRNIVFANFFGVHVSYGGAVTKVSEALDGVYNTTALTNFTPSSAKAIIFGKKVWMVLLPVIDPVTNVTGNKLFMWNGKNWWSSLQGIDLTFIGSVEVNSRLIAYGTDGTNIYPLFRTPSTAFTKTVQSKLWNTPGSYAFTKSASRLFGLTHYFDPRAGDLNISIDSEHGPSPVTIAGPGTIGPFVFPPTAIGQQGALTGLTLTTNAADMSLISIMISDQIQNYRG